MPYKPPPQPLPPGSTYPYAYMEPAVCHDEKHGKRKRFCQWIAVTHHIAGMAFILAYGIFYPENLLLPTAGYAHFILSMIALVLSYLVEDRP